MTSNALICYRLHPILREYRGKLPIKRWTGLQQRVAAKRAGRYAPRADDLSSRNPAPRAVRPGEAPAAGTSTSMVPCPVGHRIRASRPISHPTHICCAGTKGVGRMVRRGWPAMVLGLLGVLIGLVVGIRYAGQHYAADQWWPAPAVVKRVAPSVVLVKNFSKHKLQGIGSGVVVDSQGNIVTNYHVVERANRVQVMVGDRSLPGQIVGVDPPTDLAVVRIHSPAPLTAVRFARSSHIEPGQLVVAIGNSLGLSQTVTVGVISAKDRVIARDGQEYHLIQTDAAINPGNSGGPLLNSRGRLIGINSSKISRAGIEGIGLPIPTLVIRTN